jgi:signal transduction histidine kinase
VPAAVIGVALFAVAVASACVIVVWVGVSLTVLAVAGIRRLGDTYRPWCARLLGVPMPRTYRSVPEDRAIGWLTRLRGCLTDPATYRDVLWLLVNATVGLTLAILPAAFLLSTVSYLAYPLSYAVIPNFGHPWGVRSVGEAFWLWPAAAVTFALFWTTTRPLLEIHARLARWLLAPAGRDQLIARIAELTESRADTLDTQAAELRRIERDLHDGAQARLVALGMSLGMAEELLATDPDAVGDLLNEAREATGVALSELRALVRGIHPPVLADRGLEGAVRAVAMALPVPVEVSVELSGRPPEPVESAMYFAVAENLTNMAKHSDAAHAWLRLTHEDGWLRVVVGDDGRGGAVPEPGGGLDGVRRRLAAFDGKIDVHSPPGGPTTITLELPCELS